MAGSYVQLIILMRNFGKFQSGMLVLIIWQRHIAIFFSLGLDFIVCIPSRVRAYFWVNIVLTSGSTNYLKIPSQNKILYNKETENSFAGSRTSFFCTCKQLLEHCTTVPLSFWRSEFVFLKPFFSAIDAVWKNGLSAYIKAISHYYFGFKGPIVVENQSNKLYWI